MKSYRYTLLKMDGTEQPLDIGKKKDFGEFYKILDCHTIEIIPRDYYPKEWGRCTVYGDEEGRFNSDNITNPHTLVLKDSEGHDWDCVGNLLKEEVFNGA